MTHQSRVKVNVSQYLWSMRCFVCATITAAFLMPTSSPQLCRTSERLTANEHERSGARNKQSAVCLAASSPIVTEVMSTSKT